MRAGNKRTRQNGGLDRLWEFVTRDVIASTDFGLDAGGISAQTQPRAIEEARFQ